MFSEVRRLICAIAKQQRLLTAHYASPSFAKSAKGGLCNLISPKLVLSAAVLSALTQISTPAWGRDLFVSSAISLKDALIDLVQPFEQHHPGVHIVINAGASGLLERQAELGAPVDVFISAGRAEMLHLQEKKVLAGAPQTIATNRLVVVTTNAAEKFKSLKEIATRERVAIGNPVSVPAGRYAEQALTRGGVWQSLKDSKSLVFGENVRAVLTYVQNKNVDCGFVYESDALDAKGVCISYTVPVNETEKIIYQAAAMSRASDISLAKEFVQFLFSPAAQSILQKHHFRSP